MTTTQNMFDIWLTMITIALSLRSVATIATTTSNNFLNCTFDQDLCAWTQAQDDDFDWERSKGQSSSTSTGPAHDHTQGNTDGYYMSTNSKDYQLNQKARLLSPVVNIVTNQQKCFQFYYLMHGAEVGTLNVYLSPDGTLPSYPAWSRIGTRGIFYLLGQVTLNKTATVIVEGSGSSGNQGDIAIDDVSLRDGPCTSIAAPNSVNSLACDFELTDICGYANIQGTDIVWYRYLGIGSGTSQPLFDHTTRTVGGAFMAISGGNVNNRGSLVSANITMQGSFCISFFYREHGENVGLLSVSVGDYSKNVATQLWKDDGTTPGVQWNKAQVSLNISSVIKLSFDVDLLGGDGSISLDDVTILNGTCETSPDCSFDRYDLCSWRNDITHDDFDWEVATSKSDSQIFAPWRDAANNIDGGFILLDMASNPSKKEAYLVSEVITVRGIQCFTFYYYPMTRSTHYEDIPMWLNIYVTTGTEFPGTLYWTYSMTKHASVFAPGKLPLQMNKDYRLVIGGFVTLGQVLSLDMFSLLANNCSYTPAEAKPSAQTTTVVLSSAASTRPSQPPSSTTPRPHSLWDCDFEGDLCHWKSDQTTNSSWSRRQPGYYLNGPHFDHTKGPGGHGFFMTLDTISGNLQTDTALSANTSYCLVFWFYLYGSTNFEFTVQTMASSPTTLLDKHNSMGTYWHQVTIDLPVYSTSYNVQFSYQQRASESRNQLALDDLQVSEGKCSLEVGPNCTFDRGMCNWGNSKDNDFNFTQMSGADPGSQGIQSDHTTETDLGFFIKATADGHSEGQKARFQSPNLPFNNSVCLRFYYFVTQSCDSDLSIEALGPQDKHSVLLLDLQDILYGSWQLGEVTIYDPEDTQVIFSVTVGHNRSGQIGFDDVTFVDGECPYTGTMDFENGFDVFHNVYSNDFNWVIASPSDGIFPWLPAKDYSTNSPNGHFAVASFNVSNPAGKKAELWSQPSPQMDYSCASFYLYVHGSDPGTLNVTLVDYLEETRVVVWSYTPAPRNRDSQIYAQLPHVYAGQFYVVFTVVVGSDGGWAIDSIETFPFAAGMCRVLPPQAAASTVAPPTSPPPPTTPVFSHQRYGECDFEINLCNWTIPSYSEFSWNRTTGDSSDLQFAPHQGRPGGKMFFLTLPKFVPAASALLQSPSFNVQPDGSIVQRQFDFRMWLNIQGEFMGIFSIELDSQTLASTVYFRSTPTNSWEQIEFSANIRGPFSLTIEGRRGSYDLDSISIDDIEVSNTADLDDDTVYKCTFESSDLCGFKNDSTNNIDWEWRGGYNDVLMQDHTTLTEAGHVVEVSQLQGQPGDIARLISKTVPPMSGCLTFWLLMISDGAALRIYISSGLRQELILQKRNTQGYVWVKSEVPISSNMPFAVILEAEVLAARTSDLIVDDFQLSSSACSTKGACTFERDMCTWQNSLISGSNFDWMRGTGNTVGVTGPAVDSTTESSDGYYMYADSNGPHRYQDKAWLDSETFPKGARCLHFHYYMRGPSVGTLNLYIAILDSVSSVLVWSLSGDQGSDWNSAMVTVGTSLVNYNVRFEVALGFSVTSNIAIDDIIFLEDACDTQPAAAVVNTISTMTTPSVTKQSSQNILQKCDFNDVTLCGFQNDISDNTWAISGPNMPVSDTLKPFSGHTSNISDAFVYAQVGSGLKENATARFISPTYTLNNGGPKCLEFYYHMNGDQVGQMNVYIAPDGQERLLTNDMRLWSKNFDAGPGWNKGRVPILQSTNYHVVFEAVRSKFDYYYAVDDLTIFDNACEPSESCDFEEDICLWSNTGGETDSEDYWTRYQGWERTANFAPAVDHTRQTVYGYYLFVESSLTDAGSVARLYSQVFSGSNSPYCFHFWYYMFGHNLGQLKVLVRNSISSTSFYSDADLWELDGPTDDAWFLAQVNISQVYTKKPFMVILEATVGSTLQGAFGVDDTQFEMAECGTQPSAAMVTADALMLPDCDFEDGDTCDWTSLGYEMHKFTVTDAGGAILVDHNGGTGKFIVADSKVLPQSTIVVLQSALLPPTFGTSCLTFWYIMQIDAMSDLSLNLITVGSEVPLWKAFPERSNDWLLARINVQNNFDYKLVLIATVGTNNGGSVAVDDISMVHGACSRSERINFEDGLSGFTPTTSTDILWVSMVANDSFVQIDHTYHTSVGHILYADLGSTTTALKTAEIQSPLYPSVGDECMEFWYAKKGSSGGLLSVHISESVPGYVEDDSNPLWVTSADTNGIWKRVLVDISSEYPYWIVFQATANNSHVSDVLVIDDISFTTNACPSVVACDFDLSTCDYVIPRNGSIYWQTTRGVYPESLMPFDQTLQSDQGMYIEVDFPNTLSTYTADLISPVEKQLSNRCLTFWYYGSGKGTLQVFAQTSVNQRYSLVTKTISADVIEARLYRSWKSVQVDVNSTAPYSIVFEANSQKPDTSFAIDSIDLVNGTCASLTDIRPSAGTLLDPKKAMLGCDFENSDFCNFTSGSSRTFSWKLFLFNSSHTQGTGMNFDHTKFNKYGHHVYLDASGQKFNTTARLISPGFVNDKYVCLSFYYAMYGRDVNQLNAYVAQGQTNKLYWTHSGNQGDVWHHQMVEIGESPQLTQVIFEGVVGSSDQGDIDLDDIWIFDGRCPPPEYCDFEDSGICQMDQDNLDDADWVVHAAAGSDPKTDHTYGTDQGHYLLLDMSTTTSNDEARIFTQQYRVDTARCLSFWFHFTNPSSNSHTLTVSVQDERGIGTTLIVLRGYFEDDWALAIFPLKPTTNFQVVFVGQSSGSEGHIALDDITVSPNECESYIDCDFESHDMCGWEPVQAYSTPPWEVIAPNHYMTLNFSELHNKSVQMSEVKSLIIPPGLHNSFCFTFNYMMYGSNVGYLNISIEVEYPDPETVVIFSIYGDQEKDLWRYAYGDNPQMDLGISRFIITGSTTTEASNSTQTAVILISNILVVLQPCSEWLRQKESFFTCRENFQIPISNVCDFIADCVGNDDELDCGACDFENGFCKWVDDSTGAQEFTPVNVIPNTVFTDPHPGTFLTLQRAEGIPGGSGDLVLDQEIGPSPYNCTLVFSYYMSTDSQSRYGNLYVSVEENNEETVVWESSQGNNTNWQTAYVDIGSIHSRFKIHFTTKYLPFDNAMGIDDIKFSGCSFADVPSGTCATQYTCKRNGACIDSSTKFCDFTDECGDASDEDPAICGEYLMDNFEDSFGDWSQDDQDNFDWSRHSGSWVSSSSGPRRDHTLGTHFGHFLISEGGSHTDGQVARLVSPEFLPALNSDCKIRFYYHMHGSDEGQLTLYMRSKISGQMQQIGQYFTKLNDSWLFGSSTLTSSDNFQVVFEGKVVGQHSTDIGLDDVTFTPECQLKYPSQNKPGTTKAATTTMAGGITTRSGSSVQSSATTELGVTSKPSATTELGVTFKSSATTEPYVTSKSDTTSTPATVSVPLVTKTSEADNAASSGSDSWRVPVGVVLGLLALAAIIVGTFIYLRRTRRLQWLAFPLLRRGIKSGGGESNPVFEYDTTGDTSIQMSEQSVSVSEIFGESTEQNIMSSAVSQGVSNPLYTDISQPKSENSNISDV